MAKNVYTASDCLALRAHLMSHWAGVLLHEPPGRYDTEVLGELKRSLQETPNVTPLVSDKLHRWIKQTYRVSDQKKVRNFIFEEPLENVPLYVNDYLLEPFVRWRLSIAK